MYKLVTAQSQDERMQFIRQIEDLEHRGDEITHEVFKELSTNFITPFDREDIHRLVSAIDDILAPNDKFEYSRTNPVCNNPKIRLKNNGSNVLTSAVIKYGLMGEPESTYNWTGSLNTFQTIDIALSGLVSYTAGNRVFRVYLESAYC